MYGVVLNIDKGIEHGVANRKYIEDRSLRGARRFRGTGWHGTLEVYHSWFIRPMLRKRPSRVKSAGAGLAAGVVLGLAAGLFLRSDKGKQVQKDVAAKAKLLQKQLIARAELVEELSEEKYDDLIDQVLAAYAKGKAVAKEELPVLRRELRKRWKAVKNYIGKRA